ncbi:hypothetical protein PR048_031224 [Dryococelus australis]|uniref:Uncharacterized protein n=1 Tax=Dryococelus australis TaxID=614101 RepID=A0ABQ9G5E2_9NEOP|nr:hypothetical protein PR048_031224 [Dryococelus australis]
MSLECCLQNRWFSGPEADIIEQTYELVCSSEDSKALLSSFSREEGLDRVWLHILKAHSFSAKSGLLKFAKEMLVLFHGNGTLQFSENSHSNLLTENLQEQSLIAHRQVYDDVHHCGDVEHIDITKSM